MVLDALGMEPGRDFPVDLEGCAALQNPADY